MSARRWTVTVIVAAGLAGCGGGGTPAPKIHTIEQPSAPPSGAPKTMTSASADPTPSGDPIARTQPKPPPSPVRRHAPSGAPDPPGARAIRAVAQRYSDAVSVGDFAGACRTRVPSERAAWAAAGGTCADYLARVMRGENVAAFLHIRARDVRRRGDLAGVDMVLPGDRLSTLTLTARRVHGRWLLQDYPDELTP